MRHRRFTLVVAFFAALNVGLFLVPQGLALLSTTTNPLYGKNMVRSQVLETNGVTWHQDRGVVVSATSTLLTIKEADTTVQPIVVSSATKVNWQGNSMGVGSLKPGWRVLVTWPGPSGPATTVVVEKK